MSNNLANEIKDFSPEEKRALLARLLQEKANQTKTEYPLTYGQRALWFVHELAPESAAYHVASTSRIRSQVDIAAFKRSLQYLIARHPTLRTTYAQRDGQVVQLIHAHQELHFQQIDASQWDEDELYNQVVTTHKQPIDLANGPVIRWYLFTKSPTDHVFLFTVHHIAIDGHSVFTLLYELNAAYEAEVAGQAPALPPIKATYSDYVDRQAQLLASARGEQLKAYWLRQLAGELPVLNLPTDFPRPLIQSYNGASVEFVIDPHRTARIKEFARTQGVTLYVLLLSIFQTQLHRYSGQQDLLIGSPNSNRDLSEFGNTVGYFVDPIVLRSTVEADTTFKALLEQTRKTTIEAVAHQGYPFMLLVEQLEKSNDPSRSPLFQVMFNLQSLQRIESTSPLFQKEQATPNSVRLEPFPMPHEEGQFDLILDVVEVSGTLWCALKYNTDLFNKSTIERMAGHYQTLLDAAWANPQAQLAKLPMLKQGERQQLLGEWNDTQRDYPQDQCLHSLFEAQVNRTPDAIAVCFEAQTLTYAELNRRANQLAHYLQRLGVGPEQKVGIYLERSLDLIVGLYAIHKAGGAYLPLDPTYPQDRIAFMLADAQITVLLTQESLLQHLPNHAAPVVCIDRDSATIAQESVANPIANTLPQHLCYMIYTSGSTGKPKGVMIEHRNVVNFFCGMDVIIPHNPPDNPPGVWLAVTSTSFDISVLELFWTLTRGFKVVLYADARPHQLAARQADRADYSIPVLIARHGVTHLQCTPAMAEMLTIDSESKAALSLLETMLVGGEALSLALATTLRQYIRHALFNMYGPTETTIWSSTYQVETIEQTIPIGKPIANTVFYILDQAMQPMPIGVPGELYIGGAGVVRGYWNRPELTAERFIADPFSDQAEARLYKTGDLARYLSDGNVDFLGRNDFQVKIRGHRIELGEIESALDRHPAVQKSVVMAREDVPGDQKLVAYLILQGDGPTQAPDFRLFLRDALPEYMLPAAFVMMDAFPLTPNRKVDRNALPAPKEQVRPEVDIQSTPSKPMEILVAEIWREVLKVDNISIYDNFFDLGGHSLQVMQVVTRLQTKTGIKVNPVAIRMQTLGQFALACEYELANPTPVAVENKPTQKLFSAFKRLFNGKAR